MWNGVHVEVAAPGKSPWYGRILGSSQTHFTVELGGGRRTVQVEKTHVYPHPSLPFSVGAHVEVREPGDAWFGQVESYDSSGYWVRVGGTTQVVHVPRVRVAMHPSFRASLKLRWRCVQLPLPVPAGTRLEMLRHAEEEHAAHVKENPQTWKVIGEVIRQPRAVRAEPGVHLRRLDAFARLVHECIKQIGGGTKYKDPGCIAVTWLPGGFLFAANSLKKGTTELSNALMQQELIDDVSKLIFSGPDASSLFPTTLARALELGVPLEHLEIPEEEIEHARKKRFLDDRTKVRNWLKESLNITSAEQLAGKMRFIDNVVKGISHAEMRILAELLTHTKSPLQPGERVRRPEATSHKLTTLQAKLDSMAQAHRISPLAENAGFAGELDVGISFLCCEHCAYVVHAYNQWASTQKMPRLGVRGYHVVDRGGWTFVWSADKSIFSKKAPDFDTVRLQLFLAQPSMKLLNWAIHKDLEAQKAKEQQSQGSKELEPKVAEELDPRVALDSAMVTKLSATRGRGKYKPSYIGLRPSRSPSPPAIASPSSEALRLG
jgi:hypothetical protein